MPRDLAQGSPACHVPQHTLGTLGCGLLLLPPQPSLQIRQIHRPLAPPHGACGHIFPGQCHPAFHLSKPIPHEGPTTSRSSREA